MRFPKLARQLWREDDGPAMAEYALLLGLIGLLVAAAASLIGADLRDIFAKVGSSI